MEHERLVLGEVRHRFIRGWLALVLRGGLGKAVTLAGLVITSRVLAPADFGAFAILQLPLGVLSLLADAGLHAALVQRPGSLTRAEEETGFTLRVGLAVILGALTVAGAGWITQVYHLDSAARWSLGLLAVGPLVNALGTIPGVRLTRGLRFDQLAVAEMGSLIAGQAATIALAVAGAGLWSLVLGALATSLAGTLIVNILAPWPLGWRWSPAAGLPLLRFGVPYQAQGLVHIVKDRVFSALGGLVFSETQVGYLTWSQDVARWARLPADYAARIGFPAFARLQHDSAGLTEAAQEALTFTSTLSFALVAVGLTVGPRLVAPVFGPLWTPAVTPLIILLAQAPLDAMVALLLPLIYALGQAQQGLRLSLIWTGLTWGLSLAALSMWRDPAVLPVTFGLTTALALGLIVRSVQPTIRMQWWPTLGRPFALAVVVGGLLHLSMRFVR